MHLALFKAVVTAEHVLYNLTDNTHVTIKIISKERNG